VSKGNGKTGLSMKILGMLQSHIVDPLYDNNNRPTSKFNNKNT